MEVQPIHLPATTCLATSGLGRCCGGIKEVEKDNYKEGAS